MLVCAWQAELADDIFQREAASKVVVVSFKKLKKFYDFGQLLQSPKLFAWACAAMAWRVQSCRPTHIAGVDARGFIFGSVVANALGLPFVMIRKQGKMPNTAAVSTKYEKEYAETDGQDQLCVQNVNKDERFAVIDDVVATGSTLLASEQILQALGARVVAHACVVHITELGATQRLTAPIFSVIPEELCLESVGPDQGSL